MKYLLISLLISIPAMAEFTVPSLSNPVNDYSQVLTPQGKELVAHKIVELKKETGAQVGVLIIDTLDGSNLEESSMKVATTWKLGDVGKDNGALLFVVIKDRKMRIEVGKGLEGVLTDYQSKTITQSMKSYLKTQNYDKAILTGITRMIEVIKTNNTRSTVVDVKRKQLFTPSDAVLFFILFGLGLILCLYFLMRKEKPDTYSSASTSDNDVNTALAIAALSSSFSKSNRNTSDDYDSSSSISTSNSSYSSSSSSSDYSGSSSSSSDSSSSWGGGGGDFSGGGSSDSW